MAAVLERANPKERANVYAALGVTLTHQPDRDLVDAQAVPTLDRVRTGGVGGGISTPLRLVTADLIQSRNPAIPPISQSTRPGRCRTVGSCCDQSVTNR